MSSAMLLAQQKILPTWLSPVCLVLLLMFALSRWHPQSSLTHEASLAVAKVGGDEAFWQFSDALFDNQEVTYDLWLLSQANKVA